MNGSDGTTITITSRNMQPGKFQQFSDILKGSYLSPLCGERLFRCKRLLVDEVQLDPNTTQYTIFVPLTRKLAIIVFRYNRVQSEMSYHKHNIMELECSPVAVFKTQSSFLMVCMGNTVLLLYELRMELDTYHRHQRLKQPFHESLDFSQLSNFEYAVIEDTPIVYFSLGNILYVITPLEGLFEEVVISKLADCSVANLLEYVRDWTLLIYCRNGSRVTFDLNARDWFNQTSPSEDRLYTCPNRDVHLLVNPEASYVTYGLWSQNTREFFDMEGTHFHSGVCFGANRTLFAYVDREKGVYVLDPAVSSTSFHLSSKMCLVDIHCETSMLVYGNRYLVVEEQEDSSLTTLSVLDSRKNFSSFMVFNGIFFII